jgi:hypothetical protein
LIPNQLQVGTCYFGRTITQLKPYKPKAHLGIVEYTTENGENGWAGYREFCSWVVVQQGGEPTDAWHAMCMRMKKKGHAARKRVDIEGKAYRKRRGKLVEIPPEWVGKTTHPQRIRKRKSKKNQGRRFRSKAVR